MGLSSATAFATSICSNSTDTISIYSNVSLADGVNLAPDTTDSCTVNGITFSNFSISGGAGTNFTSDFSFDVVVDSNGDVNFHYSNLDGGDIELYFEVTGGMTSDDLEVGTASDITEVVCSTTFSAPNSTCLGTVLNQTSPFNVASSGPTSVTSLITPEATEYVVKDVDGGSEFTESAGGSTVPEPMTLSLMGAGLLGLGMFGRRLRRK